MVKVRKIPKCNPAILCQKGGFGMEYVLTAENLGKRYGKSKALDGFSMRIPKGSIYGFVGRNGAGKTTLIRLICGLQEPTEGSFTLYGIRNSDPGIVQARQNMVQWWKRLRCILR
jgi:ABC-2 type transport system ATP-binding protein